MDELIMYTVVGIYLLAIAGLSFIGYSQTKTASDFLVGGRGMNPIVMALSYGATFISASAIVGFGGVAAAFGMGIQWLTFLNIFVGVIIAFIVFGRPTRKLGQRLGSSTFAQFLGDFYNSGMIRRFIAIVIFVGMPLYAAVVMKGGAVFVERLFGIDYTLALILFTVIVTLYVITGGIKGVMYTDAMQATIMFSCMAFMLFWFYHSMGLSFSEANRELGAISDLVPQAMKEMGHQGWTAMPATGSPQWYRLVTSLILGVGIGCLAQPQLVVRFMMVKGDKQLNQGVVVGTLFLFITVGAIYHIGALSNLFFLKEYGKVASEAMHDIDKIIPLFIDEGMPKWFGAIFMLCILSASMSTLSAQFHTMGAAVGVDLIGRHIQSPSKTKNTTLVVRLGVIVSIIISFIICNLLSAGIIARGTALFMGVCASTFLPSYTAALFWRRVNKVGAKWSLWVGLLVSLFVMLFFYESTAAPIGLCQQFFGTPVMITSGAIKMIDPMIFSLPLSTAALIIGSLLTSKRE